MHSGAGADARAPCRHGYRYRKRKSGHRGGYNRRGPFGELRRGDEQAAIVEKDQVAEAEARARPGQRPQHREVPEQQQNQQRDVAK